MLLCHLTLGRCLVFVVTGSLIANTCTASLFIHHQGRNGPRARGGTEGSYWVSQNVWVFCKMYWKNPNEPFGQPKVILQFLSF